MGITIHYETEFRGGKKDLRAKLNEIADFARVIGFKETSPIYEMDYATDFNTPDQHTPIITDPDKPGEVEIDGSYRWAKIQAEPRAPWITREDDFATRQRKQKIARKMQKNMHRYNGLVLNLWWGEGCEPTNLCFVRTGKGMIWTGGAFTKTQYAKDFVKAHVSVCTLLKGMEKMGLIKEVSDEGDYYDTEDITQLTDASEENLKLIAAMVGTLKETLGDAVGGAGLNAEKMLEDYRS